MNHFSISTAMNGTGVDQQHDQQLVRRQGDRLEDRLQRGHVDERQLDRGGRRRPSSAAAGWCEAQSERRLALGAHRQRMRQLQEREHGEHHRLPGPAARCRPGPGPAASHRHEQAHPDGVLPEAVAQDRGARVDVAAGRMACGWAGSTPSESAGAPSVTRLIHRIWMASSGRGKPRKGASTMTQISAELVVSR